MQQNRSRGGGGKGFWILYKEKDAKNKLPNGCSCFQMGKVSVYCKNSACPLRQHRSSSRRVAAAAHFQIASKNSASTLLLLLAKLQLLPNACQASKALKAFFKGQPKVLTDFKKKDGRMSGPSFAFPSLLHTKLLSIFSIYFGRMNIEIHHEFLMGQRTHLTVKLLLRPLYVVSNSQDIQMSLVQNMRNGPKILSRCTLYTLLYNG